MTIYFKLVILCILAHLVVGFYQFGATVSLIWDFVQPKSKTKINITSVHCYSIHRRQIFTRWHIDRFRFRDSSMDCNSLAHHSTAEGRELNLKSNNFLKIHFFQDYFTKSFFIYNIVAFFVLLAVTIVHESLSHCLLLMLLLNLLTASLFALLHEIKCSVVTADKSPFIEVFSSGNGRSEYLEVA